MLCLAGGTWRSEHSRPIFLAWVSVRTGKGARRSYKHVPEPGFPCIHRTAFPRLRASQTLNLSLFEIQVPVPEKARSDNHSLLTSCSLPLVSSHLTTDCVCSASHRFSRRVDSSKVFNLHSFIWRMSIVAASRSIRALVRLMLSMRAPNLCSNLPQAVEKNIRQALCGNC